MTTMVGGAGGDPDAGMAAARWVGRTAARSGDATATDCACAS